MFWLRCAPDDDADPDEGEVEEEAVEEVGPEDLMEGGISAEPQAHFSKGAQTDGCTGLPWSSTYLGAVDPWLSETVVG
jgi:hypothetical protein